MPKPDWNNDSVVGIGFTKLNEDGKEEPKPSNLPDNPFWRDNTVRLSLTEHQRQFELKFDRDKLEARKKFLRLWCVPNDEGKNKQIKDYTKIRTIGTGSFGAVILARQKKSRKLFAVKIMPKIKVKNPQHAITERRILEATDFPFLVKYNCSFKDNDNLYLVMSFVQGGELFNFINHKGKLKEQDVKFYAAQLILALDYLHNVDIVYRDLKLENILIGKDGYLVITDFGLSKRIMERTWTIAGTPEYLAPEIIQSRGHNTAVDWWSLGILIYELAAGFTPFHQENAAVNQQKLYEKIIEGKFTFPSHFSLLLKDLLRHLIQKDLSRRFGNLKYGATQIRAHPWFSDIDWNLIYTKKEKPFFVPRLKNDEDTAYFEKYKEEDIIKRSTNECILAEEFNDF